MSLIHEVSDLFKERKGSTSIHPTWKVIELRKVCEIQNGFAFQSSEFNSNEGVPLIRIRDILKHNPETYYRGAYSDSYIVEKGDLLVGMDGDFNHSLWKGPDALLNQRVCRITPNQEILLTRFLYYGLGDYLKKINENTSSTTVKHLSSKSIGEIPFALPTLPEQQRIVAKLDVVFGHLDRVREKLDRIPELLKNFRQQVLTQAVTGELTREWREGKDLGEWEIKRINDLISKIEAGKNFSAPEVPVAEGKVGLVKISAVTWDEFDEKETKTVENKDQINPNYFIQKGDFLISRANTLELVGSSVIVKKINHKIMLSDKVWRVLFHNQTTKLFVNRFLKSPLGRKEIESRATGNQLSMRNLSQNNFKDIIIEIPPIEEQEEIIIRIDILFGLADKIESQYQSLKAKIDQMPQAILAKAFRGELVGQEVKEYVREIGELGMVAEEAVGYSKNEKSRGL